MEVVWGFAVTVELRGDGVGVLWWPCGTWAVTVGDPRVTTGLPWVTLRGPVVTTVGGRCGALL